jgi:hypothetical protein
VKKEPINDPYQLVRPSTNFDFASTRSAVPVTDSTESIIANAMLELDAQKRLENKLGREVYNAQYANTTAKNVNIYNK